MYRPNQGNLKLAVCSVTIAWALSAQVVFAQTFALEREEGAWAESLVNSRNIAVEQFGSCEKIRFTSTNWLLGSEEEMWQISFGHPQEISELSDQEEVVARSLFSRVGVPVSVVGGYTFQTAEIVGIDCGSGTYAWNISLDFEGQDWRADGLTANSPLNQNFAFDWEGFRVGDNMLNEDPQYPSTEGMFEEVLADAKYIAGRYTCNGPVSVVAATTISEQCGHGGELMPGSFLTGWLICVHKIETTMKCQR